MSSRHPRELWSGVLFLVVGLAVVIGARRYPFGTTAAMGPGYFPTLLGGILAALGVISLARSFRKGHGEPPLPPFPWRPLVAVLGSIVVFGVALPVLGLVLASMLLVGVSRAATPGYAWGEVLVLGAILTAFCSAVFVWGLKMPMSLLPAFLGT